MRRIYLSPHLDDAALCAGGLIFDQARAEAAVEIWTVMAGVPPTEELSDFALDMHARWSTSGARGTVEVRRGEDLHAADILGARAVHLEFLDAIYRRGPDGEPLYADPVGAEMSSHDAPLPEQVAAELRLRLRPDDGLVCLLGIGDHVDHVLVRAAAEMLMRPLRYVADFPYVLEHPESVKPKTRGLGESTAPVSDSGLEAWIRSVMAYRSQLEAVFEDIDPIEAIRGYCLASRGIPVWGVRPPGGLDSARKA